ncbi:MAG: GAF domain-containing sensor histidine kinase [Chloroflexota bacterium]
MANVNDSAHLTALLRLQQDLALEANVDRVLDRIVETATEVLGCERATLYVIDQGKNELWSRVLKESELTEIRLPLDGRSLAAEVARAGRLLRIDAPYEDARFDPSVDARSGFRTRSMLVAPIDARDRRRLGVLQAVNDHQGAFQEDDERLIEALAGSAGVALEYVQLTEELAAERLRVVKVVEEERHRLARELHDGVAQTLSNAAISIELVTRRAVTDVDGALADLVGIRTRLVDSQQGLRDIMFALRPLALEDGGLPAAVEALAKRINGLNGSKVVTRRVESKRRLAAEVEAGAFRVIREAANNAIKTGRAANVAIDVYDDGNAVVALVEDDGQGFDVATVLQTYAKRGSLGLLQMRESARLIGAQLSLDSSPGQGTRVRLRIPAQ